MRAAIPSSVFVLSALVGIAHGQVYPGQPMPAAPNLANTIGSAPGSNPISAVSAWFMQGQVQRYPPPWPVAPAQPPVPIAGNVPAAHSGNVATVEHAPSGQNYPPPWPLPTQAPKAAANTSAPAPVLAEDPGQVNGVITYTYYSGTKPNGKPLPGPPVDAGTYTVVATFRSADGNYTSGSSATTFTIQKATPRINVRSPGGTYTGIPVPVTGVALSPGATADDGTRVDMAGVPIPSATAKNRQPRPNQDVVPAAGAEFVPPPGPDLIPNPFPNATAPGNRMPPEAPRPALIPGASAAPQVLPNTAVNPVQIEGTPAAAPVVLEANEHACGPRFWVNAEYLMWWIKGSPQPFPLVTTSTNPGTNLSGALGQQGTTVLHGGSDVEYGLFSGFQFTGGTWIDADGWLGVEGQVFFLQCHSDTFTAGSNNAGSPPLYLPAFNTQLQGERTLIVADPVDALAGNISIVSSSQLWGAEVAGVLNVKRSNVMSIDLLGGFRYLDLDESLVLSNSTRDVGEGVVDTLRDQFDTTNKFYGALFGTRICCTYGPWLFSVAEKVAFGSTREVVSISGQINESGAGSPTPGTYLGGFYAQPTNIGQRTDNRFSVVPEVQLKVGYRFSRYVNGFVGYNFIYWTGVARPGDQIDRNLNLSQSPIFGTTGGVLEGAPSPRPLNARSDFWTQGLSLGLAINY